MLTRVVYCRREPYDMYIDAVPVAVVHDEILVEASATHAQEAARILERAMVEGMLDIFPDASTKGGVGVHIVSSWAEK